MASTALTRDTSNKFIAGVCSGIGRRFGLPPTAVRGAFLISCLLPGPQVFVYLILWALLPADG